MIVTDYNTVNFFNKIDMTDDGCWNWIASKNEKGYGRFHYNKTPVLAHRFSYQLLVGDIPKGLQLDHLCRVRHCVNPDHLEAVTPKVNTSRGNTGKHDNL